MARIFNTFGPRAIDDGRVVSNFIVQALRGEALTLYGDGSQRSFCYVSDLIEGLMRLMNGDHTGLINLGNPDEFTIRQLAELVRNRVNPQLALTEKPWFGTILINVSPESTWRGNSWAGSRLCHWSRGWTRRLLLSVVSSK